MNAHCAAMFFDLNLWLRVMFEPFPLFQIPVVKVEVPVVETKDE